MSVLTDVAVITIGGEDDAIAYVNGKLTEDDPREQQLRRTDLEKTGAGGDKVSSLVVYAACFNFADISVLEEAIRSAPWRLPSSVVAYIDGELEPAYVMSPARPGQWETCGGKHLDEVEQSETTEEPR